MNIESLRYFLELEHCRSFSQAADNVFISQQGFGKAIALLERELGMKVVERTPAGVFLTPEGAKCLEHAKRVVAEYDNMLQAIPSFYDTQERERLAWITTPYITQALISLSAPGSNFALFAQRELPFDRALETLMEAESPLVLTAEVFSWSVRELTERGFVFEPFTTSTLGVFTTSPGALDEKLHVDPEETLNLPLALYVDKSRNILYRHIFQDRWHENVMGKLGSLRSIASFVESQSQAYGMVDSLAYRMLCENDPALTNRTKFVPIDDPEAQFRIGFIYRKDTQLPDSYRQMINQTHADFAQMAR